MTLTQTINLLFLTLLATNSFSQGLFDELEELTADSTEINYTTATFKSTRIINGQSIEAPAENELLFVIAHRFGSFANGAYDLFGLDQASIRTGFEYTLPRVDCFTISFGRSTYNKTFDGGIKARLLRQKSGYKNSPISMSVYSNMALSSLRWINPDRINYFSSRLSFAHQLLIARKFSDKLSLQLSPTVIHKNLIKTSEEENTYYALAFGGRYRFAKRVAFTFEYSNFITSVSNIPKVNGQTPIGTLSLGFDIETGGHVFSLAFTNAKTMFDPGIYSETTESWADKGVHFGFNVNRTFSLGKNN